MNKNLLANHPEDSIIGQLIQKQENFRQIQKQIQEVLPKYLHDQFSVICVEDNQLIIYVNSSSIRNYLNLKQNDIIAIAHQWHIPSIKIKVKIKAPVKPPTLRLTRPTLSEDCHSKLLDLAQTTSNKGLKRLFMAVTKHNDSTR